MPALPKDAAFIAFTMCGPPSPRSFPVEVAIAMPDGMVDSWPIRPTPHWRMRGEWDQASQGQHGLTWELLDEKGADPAVIVAMLFLRTANPLRVFSGNPTADAWGNKFLFGAANRDTIFGVQPIYTLFEEIAAGQGPEWLAAADQAMREARKRVPDTGRAEANAQRLLTAARIFTGAA